MGGEGGLAAVVSSVLAAMEVYLVVLRWPESGRRHGPRVEDARSRASSTRKLSLILEGCSRLCCESRNDSGECRL